MSKMLAVVGPTASGKSDLAVALCKRYGGEVVSCDSMQIYKKMNIGTAKPTEDDMKGIAHHLVDFLEPGFEYSVSDYVSDAEKCVNELSERGVLPVFCGGTGLYIDSYLSGLEFSDFQNNPEIRQRLENELLTVGIEELYRRLSDVDWESAEKIDIHNEKRVLRALEVYETTGVSASEWNRRSLVNAKPKDCLVIGLDYENRDTLYERIDRRVDLMLEMGLLDETKMLIDEGVLSSKTASQAIAYKEFLPYFSGELSLSECVELLKRNSRRYAKRQLTWFRRNKNIKWIYRDNLTFDEVVNNAFKLADEYLSEESNG